MHIIPVIDLMHGRVVHARAGERDHYPALQSCLTPSCEPLVVLSALLDLYPFDCVYIADLDAILGTGNHREIIDEISRHYPQLDLWIDAGTYTPAVCSEPREYLTAVLGTESFPDAKTLHSTLKSLDNPVLSLDFKHDRFLGPTGLLDCPEVWPHRLIRMDLDRVGTGTGVVNRDGEWLQQHGDHAIYLAGGLRNLEDIETARQSGAAGVLLASAFHDGRITAADIKSLYHLTSISHA